ncbi:Spermine/spermidine synthase [Ancylostoma caninum]|uniref:Spermine/spermidine synthase n=1 Tax=Ancylostoma caninum TaxID=29170 RepID=A0A368GEA4_ANCCA|nr:Spermine/spermidine synthase [Ancylostoma caninum]
MCSPQTNECFKIQDAVFVKDGRIVVDRHMMIGDTLYSFSAAALIVPQELTEDNWDMQKWKINKSILISGYGKVMVGFVFAMEGLKYVSSNPQNVLMIGLGGGVMTNFLSTLHDAKLNITTVELDPTVRDVAVKWFELVENDEHTVIIGDGAKFITDEAKKGSKYNAIFLDACYTVCPAKVFLDPNVIADTARIVADDGVLAINVLTEMDKRSEQSDHILNVYKAGFESCFLFYIRAQQVLLCSHRANWTLEEQTDHFMEKLKEVDENFEFNFTR